MFTTDANTNTILPKNANTESNTILQETIYSSDQKCQYNTDVGHSTKTLQNAISTPQQVSF